VVLLLLMLLLLMLLSLLLQVVPLQLLLRDAHLSLSAVLHQCGAARHVGMQSLHSCLAAPLTIIRAVLLSLPTTATTATVVQLHHAH
jgi:hypothetical protein